MAATASSWRRSPEERDWECRLMWCQPLANRAATGIPRGDRHEVRLRGSLGRHRSGQSNKSWPPPPSTCWPRSPTPTTISTCSRRTCWSSTSVVLRTFFEEFFFFWKHWTWIRILKRSDAWSCLLLLCYENLGASLLLCCAVVITYVRTCWGDEWTMSRRFGKPVKPSSVGEG